MTSELKRYLEETHSQQDDYYDREIGEYHASTAGNCVRRNYLDFVEGSEPGEDAWPHFTLGNVLEDVYLDVLRNEYGWRNVKNSIPVELDMGSFTIVGETDPVVVDPNLEVRHLYEIKTTKNVKYTRKEPKEGHLYQAHVYMKALGIKEARIVYIQKTDLDTVMHEVEFDPEIWMDIEMRFTRLHQALTSGEMPDPVDEDDRDYFCPHEGLCCKNQ